MLIYWVAIGARTANKLSPPCLKGYALPILKRLSCPHELRLQVKAMQMIQPMRRALVSLEKHIATMSVRPIRCVICAGTCSEVGKDFVHSSVFYTIRPAIDL